MQRTGLMKKNTYILFFSTVLIMATSSAQELLDSAVVQDIQATDAPVLEQPMDSLAPEMPAATMPSAPMPERSPEPIFDAAPVEQLPTPQKNVVKMIPAGPQISTEAPIIKKESVAPTPLAKKQKKSLISFDYTGQDLLTIINDITARKKINFILPQGEDAKILSQAKLTLSFGHEITLDKAWQLLQTALDFAGFSIMPKGNMYQIVKTTDTTATEPAPLYIDVPYNELPDSQQRIRYISYLANIKVSDETEGELQAVLKTLLPEIPKNAFVIDKRTNSILVMAKSFEIKALMEIISQLDKAGFQEKIEVIKLRHTDARTVAALFQNNILKAPDQGINRYHIDARKQTEATYFSQFARVIAEPRINALIVVGRTQAVDRIKNFIQESVDIELGTGKSILHVYQLQYLNALDFKPVLQNIVTGAKQGGTEQSKAGGTAAVGPERYFDEVIIETDTPADTANQAAAQAASAQDTSLAPPARTSGSNSLIIACGNADWGIIKDTIEKLDTPVPQVLLEVFIADLTDDDLRALGATVRNPLKLPLFNQMNFQSGQLNPGIVTDAGICDPSVSPIAGAVPSTVGVVVQEGIETAAADILGPNKGLVTCGTGATAAMIDNPAGMAQVGSTIISLNDNNGKTWGVAQLLKVITTSRIIAHPHVISVSNKEALVQIGDRKLLPDALAGSGGSTLAQKQAYVDAYLTVKINPRINMDEDSVNLSIMVTSNAFETTAATDGNILVRQVVTNASVKSKEMLALGGLMRNSDVYNTSKTPLLGDVPILGQLFKNRTQEKVNTNFTLFIVPTIIKPRLRGGMGDITRKYASIARSYTPDSNLFDNLRDPISHWYFKTNMMEADHTISDFLDKDEVFNTIPSPDERRKQFAANQTDLTEPARLNNAVVDDIRADKSPFRKEKHRAKAHLRS